MKHINKKLIIGGAGVLLWASAFIAFAQTPVPAGTSQELREKAQTIREETRIKTDAVRVEARTAVQNARKEVEARREELKKQLEAKREEAKKRVEAAREEAKTRVKAAHEELKKKIEQIKDERKKATVTRLDEQMNHLNERWTTHFTNVLNHLEDILGKIQVRMDKAASLGKDVSAVKTAIDTAKAAIASARTAVEVQAKKDYTITFTSEDQLHTAFKAAKGQLHKDLTALRDGVIKAARDTVHQAARTLGGVPKVDEEPEVSPAPAPTSTP
ncbi:MAG: hypothetical protein Q7R91_01005 [bacterium]|nr:hypothetical protein [bacterium]